jgi:hypothetical protein
MPRPDGLSTGAQRVVDRIGTLQDAHFSKEGQYWQGNPKKKPTNEKVDWDGFGLRKADIDDQEPEVHVYEGPHGHGYVLQFTRKKGDETYVKTVNYGPETEKEHDWELVEVEEKPIPEIIDVTPRPEPEPKPRREPEPLKPRPEPDDSGSGSTVLPERPRIDLTPR